MKKDNASLTTGGHRVKLGFWSCLFLIAAFSYPGHFATAEELARVDVSGKVEIRGDRIFLGDVAEISGGQPELVGNLEKIHICKAPRPGEELQIDGDAVKRRIKQNGYDLSVIHVNAPPKINIVRKSEQVSAQYIEEAVRSFVEAKLLGQNRPATIRSIEVPRSAVLPLGEVTHKVKLLNGALLKRKVPVHFHLYVDEEWVRKILVMVELEMVDDVVVARRLLKRGRVISEADIAIRTLDVSGMPSNIITRTEDVLGKKVKRDIKALHVVRTDMVEQPMMVKRGDIVQVIAESERLRISTMGIIKGIGGRSGERIRVVNIDSNRSLYARVVDAKTVRVEYAE